AGPSSGPAPWVRTLRSVERAIDRRQHRLAVGVPELVLADLAELGGSEASELGLHLAGGQLVVAGNWERGAPADGPAGSVGAADDQVDGLAEMRAPGRRIDLITSPSEQPLEISEQLLGLLAATLDELGDEVVRVAASEPAS